MILSAMILSIIPKIIILQTKKETNNEKNKNRVITTVPQAIR